MGEPTEPKPVKLFTGLLTSRPEIFSSVEEELRAEFGPADLESELIPFDFTDYYSEEMGEDIKRKFISFEELIDPGDIADIKLNTNEAEEEFSEELDVDLPRPINIDPGYVGQSKMVLATTKNYSHRIYIRSGIYAEVTFQYKDGSFRALQWTYPDYRSEEYLEFFERVRTRYCEQLN
ncbi:MAG: DUF4416 family protein [Candidatus Bipolaricaulota bacterium]|nr:DUF4416 family protein [Candidatus Bipolaricaulota bacterium]MBS3792202.1 DUF4416 family protein [Candidatus Bipolaricaulota bacterium]